MQDAEERYGEEERVTMRILGIAIRGGTEGLVLGIEGEVRDTGTVKANLGGEEELMPGDWEESRTVNVFKNEGDVMQSGIYRGIKLTEYLLNVLERKLDEMLQLIVKNDEEKYRFFRVKDTADPVFLIRQLQEKRLEGNRKFYGT
ncbi:uncharacterized protein [Macrobrachium rosenbergii]|uniref:uncharacterized protein n=1 Tax=Macrobrachium rosenbergii TaxID=79674 RepID=UPI0034D422F9